MIVGALNLPADWFSIRQLVDNDLGALSTTNLVGTDNLTDFPTLYNANLAILDSELFELSDWFATTSHLLISNLPSLDTVGTITTGVWTGTAINVAQGGTGSTTLSAFSVLLGSTTNAVGIVSGLGTNGQVLTSSGAGVPPAWGNTSVAVGDKYKWTDTHNWSAATYMTALNASSTVIFNGLSLAWPSSDGTASSTALLTDGSGGLSFNIISQALEATTTQAQIISSTSSTTLFTTSVPANALGTDNVIHVQLTIGEFFVTNGNTFFFSLNYGSQDVSGQMTNSTGTTHHPEFGIIDLYLTGADSTGAQGATISISALQGGLLASGETASFAKSGALTVDSTSAQTLNFVGKMSNSGAADRIDIDNSVANLMIQQ
ncbi:MAG TPA: hypothetical protein ENI23_11215 [bacterium]|nr:hypothetical protein [bacterium]